MQHRGLRLVFIANMISMIGSGMNTAAVTWHILQKTGDEVHLSYLVMLQTLPAVLLLPLSGVIIDREDRRHLVMTLDVARAVIIAAVAALALSGRAQLWHLYVMNTLVALGFWMFWPTITALIQELTPESEVVHSNTFLMSGVQAGWLFAGALVGFVYNTIGLGGILLIDVCSYAASFSLYLFVREGKHVVARPETPHLDAKSGFAKFVHELSEGLHWVRKRPAILVLGTTWALFLGGMLTQGVITAPLSDRILHAGAVGYGWLNAGWGVGAFLNAFYASKMITRFGALRAVTFSMALLSAGLFVAPFSQVVLLATLTFFVMGSARGLAGIAITSSMMQAIPKHMIGRVQNTFYFLGLCLQLVLGWGVGAVAHRVSLTNAFFMVGAVYAVSSALTLLPAARAKGAEESA